MSNVTDNSCGNVYVLSPSHEVRLTSNGLAPKGYCGVSVFTPKEVGDYKCDALCVTYKTASISTCEVKVKFVGHKFRKGGDLVKVNMTGFSVAQFLGKATPFSFTILSHTSINSNR